MTNMDDNEPTVIPGPSGNRKATLHLTGSAAMGVKEVSETFDRNDRYFLADDLSTARAAVVGCNPLLELAGAMLLESAKIRRTFRCADIEILHQRLSAEVRNYGKLAAEYGYSADTILASRYFMCSVLDEAVLSTAWGGNSGWGRKTLLRIFHGDTAGGEKCFQILHRLSASPAENLHALELFFAGLSLGFEGKYRLVNRGSERLEQLRRKLFGVIRHHRGEPDPDLSPEWKTEFAPSRPLKKVVSYRAIAGIAVLIFIFLYSAFSLLLRHHTDPLLHRLDAFQLRLEGESHRPRSLAVVGALRHPDEFAAHKDAFRSGEN